MDTRKNFYKILVVGESASGKTSLIKMIHNWHKYVAQSASSGNQMSPNKGIEEHQDSYQMRLLDRMSKKEQIASQEVQFKISESAPFDDTKQVQNIQKSLQMVDEVLEKQDTALNSLSSSNQENNSQKVNAKKAKQVLDLSPLPKHQDDNENNIVCMRAVGNEGGLNQDKQPAKGEFQLILEKRQRTTDDANDQYADKKLQTNLKIPTDLIPKKDQMKQSSLLQKNKNLTTDNTPRQLKQKLKKSHLKYLNSNTDFTLKIMDIEGEKVRIQLWDQGQNRDPRTTFQPLYTRNVSACIVVANSSNPQSIKRAQAWKEQFDLTTKIKDEPAIPCTLFINHDKMLQKDTESKIKIENQANIKLNQQNTPNYQEEIHDDNDQSQIPFTSNINWDEQTHLESLANMQKNGYFGVYHTALGQPESIKEAFENFIWRIMEDHRYTQRTYSVSSQFFDQFESKFIQAQFQRSLSVTQQNQMQQNSEQKTLNPSVNQRLSDNESFKLQPLASRRYGSNVEDKDSSCCNN